MHSGYEKLASSPEIAGIFFPKYPLSYQFGANSYIKKPATYEVLLDKLKTLVKFWFDVAKVPTGKCLKTCAENQV